jgi:hypothetical protein
MTKRLNSSELEREREERKKEKRRKRGERGRGGGERDNQRCIGINPIITPRMRNAILGSKALDGAICTIWIRYRKNHSDGAILATPDGALQYQMVLPIE